MSDLVQIARSRIDNTQRTHWNGCVRSHRECLIQRMADEIELLRARITGAEVLTAYDRDDGLRGWVDAGAWLSPGDRIVVLRREEQR